MTHEPAPLFRASDVDEAARDWIKRGVILLVSMAFLAVSTVLGWPWIKELARGEDLIRQMPGIIETQKRQAEQIADMQRLLVAQQKHIDEVMRYFPRTPAWQASTAPAR